MEELTEQLKSLKIMAIKFKDDISILKEIKKIEKQISDKLEKIEIDATLNQFNLGY